MKVRTMNEAVRNAKKRYYRSRAHLIIDKVRGHHDYRKAMLWTLVPSQYNRFIRKARRALLRVRNDQRNLRVSSLQLGKLRLIHSKRIYYVDDTHLVGDEAHQVMKSLY